MQNSEVATHGTPNEDELAEMESVLDEELLNKEMMDEMPKKSKKVFVPVSKASYREYLESLKADGKLLNFQNDINGTFSA